MGFYLFLNFTQLGYLTVSFVVVKINAGNTLLTKGDVAKMNLFYMRVYQGIFCG